MIEPDDAGRHLLSVFDSAVAAPVALVVAILVGAAHGLAPGHGKTLAVAYLVGTRAQPRHALALAALVAAMHTGSVALLGMIWWLAVGDGPVPVAEATRWAQLAMAAVVMCLGIVMCVRRCRKIRGGDSEHGHGHAHGHGHPHGHGHGLADGHGHHLGSGTEGRPARDVVPWSWPGIVAVAGAGGLLPSPSAFLVLVSGLLTGRVGLALGMVTAFGAGLAATVLAAGLVTVAGRDWLTRRAHTQVPGSWRWRIANRLPLAGALAVMVGGLVLCVHAAGNLMGGA